MQRKNKKITHKNKLDKFKQLGDLLEDLLKTNAVYFESIPTAITTQLNELKKTIVALEAELAPLKKEKTKNNPTAKINNCGMMIEKILKAILNFLDKPNAKKDLLTINQILDDPILSNSKESIEKNITNLFEIKFKQLFIALQILIKHNNAMIIELLESNLAITHSRFDNRYETLILSDAISHLKNQNDSLDTEIQLSYLTTYKKMINESNKMHYQELQKLANLQQSFMTSFLEERKKSPNPQLKFIILRHSKARLEYDEMRDYAIAWKILLNNNEEAALQVLQYFAITACHANLAESKLPIHTHDDLAIFLSKITGLSNSHQEKIINMLINTMDEDYKLTKCLDALQIESQFLKYSTPKYNPEHFSLLAKNVNQQPLILKHQSQFLIFEKRFVQICNESHFMEFFKNSEPNEALEKRIDAFDKKIIELKKLMNIAIQLQDKKIVIEKQITKIKENLIHACFLFNSEISKSSTNSSIINFISDKNHLGLIMEALSKPSSIKMANDYYLTEVETHYHDNKKDEILLFKITDYCKTILDLYLTNSKNQIHNIDPIYLKELDDLSHDFDKFHKEYKSVLEPEKLAHIISKIGLLHETPTSPNSTPEDDHKTSLVKG